MVTTKHVTADRNNTWHAPSHEAVHGFGRPYARIAWGAIFAGTVVALAVQLVLTLIGGAIGLTTLNPATGESPSGTTLGIGAAIWLVISSLISFLVAGYVAGRLGGTFNGWLHGLATWATVTTFTILLLATAAGGLVGATSGLGAFAVGNSDKMSRTQLPPTVQHQIDQLTAQARQTADQTSAQAQQMMPENRETQARELGQRAAKNGAAGSGAASIGLILGAVAAAIGGKVGQRLPFGKTEVEEDDQTDSAAKATASINSEKLMLVSTTARRHATKRDNSKLSSEPRSKKRKSQLREKSAAASKSMELKPTALEGLSHGSPPPSSVG